jgi:hypothetical protein
MRNCMDKIKAPEIISVVAKGDDYLGISMIKVISDHECQTELRIRTFPISFELSYVNKRHVRVGVRLFKFLIGLEFDYAPA